MVLKVEVVVFVRIYVIFVVLTVVLVVVGISMEAAMSMRASVDHRVVVLLAFGRPYSAYVISYDETEIVSTLSRD